MATVTVEPRTFDLVDFDHGVIVGLLADVCERVGAGDDVSVSLRIEETEMVGRVLSVACGPGTVDIHLTGGALEDLHRPRQLSTDRATTVLALVLRRALDRLGPFADAPADADLTVRQWTAWDTYTEGRLERAGFRTRKQRRRYHFRLKHGFSDRIDEVFERLWAAESLRWADIVEACLETEALDAGPITTTPG